MKTIRWRLAALVFVSVLTGAAAAADSVSVELKSGRGDPPVPRMGDRLLLHSTIRNGGAAPLEGLIAWISLVRIDKGKEQPMDLEDWSAQKAVTVPALAPGQSLDSTWPMRLIQDGTYRVVVSAVSRNGRELTPSPFYDFVVHPKPVVESQRVLPVALGLPLLIGVMLLWRLRKQARDGAQPTRALDSRHPITG